MLGPFLLLFFVCLGYLLVKSSIIEFNCPLSVLDIVYCVVQKIPS